jgi:hypothetical protein
VIAIGISEVRYSLQLKDLLVVCGETLDLWIQLDVLSDFFQPLESLGRVSIYRPDV